MVAEGAIRERRPREYAPYVEATSGDDRGETRLATHRAAGFLVRDGGGETCRGMTNQTQRSPSLACCARAVEKWGAFVCSGWIGPV
jgi:hypothetical protein